MEINLPKVPFHGLITGRTGCGKTYLLLKLLDQDLKDVFDTIIIFCPTIKNNTTYKEFKFIDHDPNIIIMNPVDVTNSLNDCLKEVINVLEKVPNSGQTLIIIDDCSNLHDSKIKSSQLTQLAFSGRHVGISVIVLTQKYNAIVKDFRDQIKFLVLHFEKDMESFKSALQENDIIESSEKKHIIEELKDGKTLVMTLEKPFLYALINGRD